MDIYYSPSSPLVYHERAVITLVITTTPKCRHIHSHYGIVTPFFILLVGMMYNCTWHILVHVLPFGVVYACVWTYAVCSVCVQHVGYCF